MSTRWSNILIFSAPMTFASEAREVGIETVIRAFCDGHSSEAIQQEYPTLALEQVYCASVTD